MAQQIINIGPAPNDGLGDPIRTAFAKTNNNFSQLYSIAQSSPPPTLVGSVGDFAGMYAYSGLYFYYCFAPYDGTSVIWAKISNSGNVVATSIINGTSNVSIASANSNVSVSVNGTSNVAIFSTAGLLVSGIVSAAGNVRGANINTAGGVSAAGNITGNYILGNGSQLTGLPATYGNSNVAAYLPTYSGNLYPTAVYTDNYLYANGVPFSGSGGGNYTNANVAAYLPTYSGNLGGTLTTGPQTNITTVGNLSGLTVNGLNSVTISPSANNVVISPTFGGVVTVSPAGTGSIDNMIIGGNTPESGSFTTVSASGNITTASYFKGDGSQLTNLPVGNYSNADVAAYLTTYTGNLTAGNISTAGTVAGNVTGNVTGVVDGQLYGLVDGVNTIYGTWDFGYITANTYSNPIQWIFAVTPAGNIDMGNITAPTPLSIDIGTIF